MTFDQMLAEMQRTCVCGCDWPCEYRHGTEEHRPIVSDRDFEWHICDRCRGDGELRGWPGAYTESDRAEWSYEDYEDYRNYRRTCEDCGGTGKVRELTEAALARPDVREWINDWHDTESIYRMERMMGA